MRLFDGHHEGREAAQESNSPPTPDRRLDAAGCLCAVQLISGVAGYTLHGQADEDYPAPDQCNYDSPETLRSALATKLFKGVSNDRFTPVHRHIAEFLGARYLAGVIRKRASRSARDRPDCGRGRHRGYRDEGAYPLGSQPIAKTPGRTSSRANPIGVGLYGDIREFSTDDKRTHCIESLNCEGIRLSSVWETSATFGVLVTPEMRQKDMYLQLDRTGRRSLQIARYARYGTRAQGDPEATTTASETTRCSPDFVLRRSWRKVGPCRVFPIFCSKSSATTLYGRRVNYAALNAFIHNCSDIAQNKTDKLKALLADVHTGSIPDTDNELLGTLLAQLYPQELPPSEVWDYLSEKGNPELIGRHLRFWDAGLIEKSSDGQVAELLDNLERLPRLQSALDVRHLNSLPLKLLARGLKAHGDQLDTKRLYDWLDVGFAENQDAFWRRAEEAIREIRSWLEQRPEIHKAVFLEGLSRGPESDEFRWHAINVRNRLYDSSPPPDFGLWCLKQAVAMADTKPRVAEYLLEWAVWSEKNLNGNEGLSLEVLKEHVQDNETLSSNLTRLLSPPSTPPIPPELLKLARNTPKSESSKRRNGLSMSAPMRLHCVRTEPPPTYFTRWPTLISGTFSVWATIPD